MQQCEDPVPILGVSSLDRRASNEFESEIPKLPNCVQPCKFVHALLVIPRAPEVSDAEAPGHLARAIEVLGPRLDDAEFICRNPIRVPPRVEGSVEPLVGTDAGEAPCLVKNARRVGLGDFGLEELQGNGVIEPAVVGAEDFAKRSLADLATQLQMAPPARAARFPACRQRTGFAKARASITDRPGAGKIGNRIVDGGSVLFRRSPRSDGGSRGCCGGHRLMERLRDH